MKKSEFNWVAPRYLDGEATDAERHAIESKLLADTSAQRSMELLERESSWMGKAFRRSPEDISRIVIRVRRRNPHRKLYVSPVVIVSIQLLLIIGLFWQMSVLSKQLSPPKATLSEVEHEVSVGDQHFQIRIIEGESALVDDERLTEELTRLSIERGSDFNANELIPKELRLGGLSQRLALEEPVTTLDRGQIRMRVGIADEVNLNRDSSLRVLRPEHREHHVVQLERGELWARMVDSEKRFCFRITELPNVRITGNRAEVNLIAGIQRTREMLPRGYVAPSGRTDRAPVALLRVFDGAVGLTTGEDKPIALRAGTVRVLYRDGSVSASINDPDAEHYSVLRRLEGRFRSGWQLIDETHYPLARERATYPVWKDLLEIVEDIDGRLQSLREIQTQEYIDRLLTIAGELQEAGQDERVPQVDGGPDFYSDAFNNLRRELVLQFEAGKLSVAESGVPADPALSLMLRELIDPMLAAWQAEDIDWRPPFSEKDYVTLFSSDDIGKVAQLLSGFAQDLQVRLTSASHELQVILNDTRGNTTVDREVLSLDARKQQYEKALQNYRRELESKYRDPDGTERARLEAEELELERERTALKAVELEIDRLTTELSGPTDKLERLQQNRVPLKARVDQLELSIGQLRQEIERNDFNEDALNKAKEELSRADAERMTQKLFFEERTKEWEKLKERKVELDTKSGELGLALKAVLQQQGALYTESEELIGSVGMQRPVIAELEIELRAARAAYRKLSRDRRAGSAEEAEVNRVQAALAATNERLDSLLESFNAKTDELVQIERERQRLTTEIQSLEGTEIPEHAKELEGSKGAKDAAEAASRDAEQAHERAEVALKALEASQSKLNSDTAALNQLEEEQPGAIKALDDVNTKIAEQEALIKPRREKLQLKVEELREKTGPLNDRIEKNTRELELIRATQRNIRDLRDNAVEKQTMWLDSLRNALDRHLRLGAAMTRTTRKVADDIDSLELERDEQLNLASDATLGDGERAAAQELGLSIGAELGTELVTSVAREEESNIRTHDRLWGQYLAHEWLRVQAGLLEDEMLDQSDAQVTEFQEYLRRREGFAEMLSPAKAENAGSDEASELEPIIGKTVFEVLSQHATPQPKYDSLSAQDRARLMQTAWSLFASFRIESIRDERLRMANDTGQVSSGGFISYLSALQSMNSDTAVSQIASSWNGELATMLLAASKTKGQANQK